MRGPDPGSSDIVDDDLEHSELSKDLLFSSERHECSTWANTSFEMPVACLDFLEVMPLWESAASSGVATSGTTAVVRAQVLEPDNIQTTAGFRLFDTSCSTTFSAAHASPVGDVLPPHLDAPDAPTLSLMPPSCAEPESSGPQSTGSPQGTAATGAVAVPVQGAVCLGVAAEPLITQSLLPRMPRVPPGPKATKSRSGFAQRNRVRCLLVNEKSCSLS